MELLYLYPIQQCRDVIVGMWCTTTTKPKLGPLPKQMKLQRTYLHYYMPNNPLSPSQSQSQSQSQSPTIQGQGQASHQYHIIHIHIHILKIHNINNQHTHRIQIKHTFKHKRPRRRTLQWVPPLPPPVAVLYQH